MTFTGNTVPYKSVWIAEYQATHYKQPVFPVFADQRFQDQLTAGQTLKWSYDSDSDVASMALATGAYEVANKTVTDETLTVDQAPTSAFRIPLTENIQDHRPTQAKWAQKAMNRIFWKMDAQMLGAMAAAATSTIDASDGFGGSSGAGIAPTPSNAPAIFTAARRKLRNQNVIYDETRKWTGYMKLDNEAPMPVCAIPPELEEQLLLAIGFKPGDMGDQVLKQGAMGFLFGFNAFVSTALPFQVKYTVASGNLSNGDTMVLGGNTFTFVSGTPSNAGEIKIGASATLTGDNIATALTAPFTDVSNVYKAFTRSSLTVAQALVLGDSAAPLISATNASGVVTIVALGNSSLSYSTTASNGSFSAPIIKALFGVSKSIALVMQRYPSLTVSEGNIIGNGSTGGYVARDFVTWTLAGWKVFNTMAKQLVTVLIDATGFTAPNNVYN